MDTDDVNDLGCTDENQHQVPVANTNIPITSKNGDEEKPLIVGSLLTSTVSGTSTAAASTPVAVEKLRIVEGAISMPAECTTNSTNDTSTSALGTIPTADLVRSAMEKPAHEYNEPVTASNLTTTTYTTTITATTPVSTSNCISDTQTKTNSTTPATICRGPNGSFQPDPAFKDPVTGLSMSAGAIRARQRRAREREEKQKERQRLEFVKKTGGTKQGNTSNDTTAHASEPTMPFRVYKSNFLQGEAINVYDATVANTTLVLIGNGPAVVESENNYCTNPLAIRLNALHQRRRQQQQLHRDANVRRSRRRHQARSHDRSPQATHQQQLTVSPAASTGSSSLIASKLPLAFPPEEAFRALSLYATLRTFSLQLRLSPFTPNSFLLGLTCPFMTRLIGEVHVTLLRLLFLNIGRGPDFYRIGANSAIFHGKLSSTSRQGALPTTDSNTSLMGSECLSYMDVGSWPLFYVDYVEATKAKFLELDAVGPEIEANEESPVWKHVTPIPADNFRTATFSGMPERYNSHGGGTTMNFPEIKTLVKDESIPTLAALTQEEMKTLLLDLVDKVSRKADGYGFFSRPVNPVEDQCPDYFEIVDEVHEAMDLGTVRQMVIDSEISTLDKLEQYLNRIVLSSRKYNTDEENFVRKQTERFDLIAKSVVQKTKINLGCPDIPQDNASSSVALSSTSMTTPYSSFKALEKPMPPLFMRQRVSLSSDICFDHESGRKKSSNQKEPSLFSAGKEQESNYPTAESPSDHPNDKSEHYSSTSSGIKKPLRQHSFLFKRKFSSISISSGSKPQTQQQRQDFPVHSGKRNSLMTKSLESLASSNELLAFVSNSNHSNKEILDDEEDNNKNSDYIADESMNIAKDSFGDSPKTSAEVASHQQIGARRSKRTRIRSIDLQKEVGSAFDSLPHVQAARKIEDLNSNSFRNKQFPSCYGSLPISSKLDVLQFLLDELMQVDHIEAELNKRYDITRCFQPLEYAPLPSKEEMDRLSNVDDCVLCNYPGDLVCCDGCPNSFHKRCCSYVESPPNLPKQQMDSVDEEKWLCPECLVQDSSKLGNLHGGRKPSLYWWNKDDLDRFFKLSPPSSSADKPLCTELPNHDVADADNESESLCAPEGISSKEFLIIHGFVFQRPTSRETDPILLNQIQLLDLLRALGPSICSEWPWSQIPVNPSEIWCELGNSPSNKIKSTFQKFQCLNNCYLTSQASFNPTIYKNMYKFAPPTPAYLQHQPIPKHLYQAISPGELFVANYDQLVSSCLLAGVMEDENSSDMVIKVDLPIHPQVTSDVYNDPIVLIYDKLLRFTDPLKPVKDYLFSLERVLFRAYLLHESWGMKWNKCKDRRIASIFSYRESNGKDRKCAKASNSVIVSSFNVSWGFHLFHAQTISQVCRCAVRLIDAVETRAFHEEWNKIPYKGSGAAFPDAETAALRSYIDLPEHWTPEKVIMKRKWERSSDLMEGRNLFFGESDKNASNFFPSAGRKGRKRPKSKEVDNEVTAQYQASSDNDSNILDTCNLPVLKPNGAAPRRGRPSKSQNRSSVTKSCVVREFKLQCVHCNNILTYSFSLNGVQHSTKDFFNHIQECPSCPDKIKKETALLRSQKEKSSDGPSFYKLLVERARNFLSRDAQDSSRSSDVHVVDEKGSDFDCLSHSVTFQEKEPEELLSKELDCDVLNPSKSVVDLPAGIDMNSEVEAIQGTPAVTLSKSSTKQILVSNTDCTEGVPYKAVDGQHANARECDISGIQGMNVRLKEENPFLCFTANAGQRQSRDSFVDQPEETQGYSCSSDKYVLVDSTDARLASKYILSLYKNFIPSAMVQAPFKKPRVADAVNVERYSASAPRTRGQRGVSDRFFVGCAYCGFIPSLGIKVGGPQHTTKDLYYHLCDCKKCPGAVKALIGKIRSMGLKSHDSAKYFKLQLSRLAQHVNNRSASQLRAELLYQISQREGDLDIAQDLSSEHCIYNFEDSSYPLVKKEDEYIGSSYFSALYKHFWPVGKNFGDKRELDSDVSLIFSSSHKSMVWQSNTSTDAIAKLVADKGSLEEIVEDEFHPDEETIVVVTEMLDDSGLRDMKDKHATFGKAIVGDEQGFTTKQEKEDMKNDVIDDNSDDVSKCSKMPEKDVITYRKTAPRNDSAQSVINETGFNESNCPHATSESDVVATETCINDVAEKATFKELNCTVVTKAAVSKERESEQHVTCEGSSKLECMQTTQDAEVTPVKSTLEECADNKNVSVTSLDRKVFQSSHSEADLLNNKSNANTDTEAAANFACQAIVQVSDGGDEHQEDNSEGDLDSGRKDGRAVRRSGRVQFLRNSVQEKIGSYAEKTMPALESVYKWVASAAEEEALQKIRNTRMANLEKLLAAPFEKEAFWPICGRLYIPPVGSLSPAIMRYLGRNFGSRVAPYMLYSEKHEVGQPSVRQRWRTNTMECESIEELHLQFQILENHLNRTVSLFHFSARLSIYKLLFFSLNIDVFFSISASEDYQFL